MKVIDAISWLQRFTRFAGSSRDDIELVVSVFAPGSAGPTPTVGVKQVQQGIDWDKNRVILQLDTPVTRLTPEQCEAIEQSVRDGQSWHAFERERTLYERIHALETELADTKEKLRRSSTRHE